MIFVGNCKWRRMMENLDRKIAALQLEMQQKYDAGDKAGALKISQQLDSLIALRQREYLILRTKP